MTYGVDDAGGIRSTFPTFIPNWLANRVGKNGGFRFLWVLAFYCDLFIQSMLEGYRAPLPGIGTDTALDTIGQSRGLSRGVGESDAAYTARLINWRVTARQQGRQLGIVEQFQLHVPGSPKVSVINRVGAWTTVDSAGHITTGLTVLWNWDGTDCPYRANYWSDEWVIVYPSPWAFSTRKFGDGGYTFGDSPLGVGQLVTREYFGDGQAVLLQMKAAHSNIRAVIFTTDASLFDFSNAGTLPNGNWGKWGVDLAGTYVASARNLTTCRYWEPTIADGPNP